MTAPKTLDLVALRALAGAAVETYPPGWYGAEFKMPAVLSDQDARFIAALTPAVVLSLLDQIDEWEATDKANADERKQLGAALNRAKSQVEEALQSRGDRLRRSELVTRLEAERLDVTLPGTAFPHGYRHPLSLRHPGRGSRYQGVVPICVQRCRHVAQGRSVAGQAQW